jgi:hypothetical protein
MRQRKGLFVAASCARFAHESRFQKQNCDLINSAGARNCVRKSGGTRVSKNVRTTRSLPFFAGGNSPNLRCAFHSFHNFHGPNTRGGRASYQINDVFLVIGKLIGVVLLPNCRVSRLTLVVLIDDLFNWRPGCPICIPKSKEGSHSTRSDRQPSEFRLLYRDARRRSPRWQAIWIA